MKALLALFACLVLAVQTLPSDAAGVPKFIKKGADYLSVRDRLFESWYAEGKPVRLGHVCPGWSANCSLPEARQCSETGFGVCKMQWRHPDGTVLVVVTTRDRRVVVSGHIRRK